MTTRSDELDVFRADNYREILRQEYLRRIETNRQYSLRAYARDLKLSPSRLSDVLNSKGNFSRRNAHLIASALNFNDSETEMFLALVESENPKSATLRRSAQLRVKQSRVTNLQHKISVDRFKVISDWYHLALLELFTLKDFRNSTKWMANALNISVPEVEAALERLARLELLEVKQGRYRLLVDQTSTKSGSVPSGAIIKAHTQLMHKAADSLQRANLDEREFGSLILAVDSSKMARAKQLIRGFRKEFNEEMGASSKKDCVYCLSVQFFQLTKSL